MTFDPFGDFETRGYLRNIAGEKDPDIVRRLEHHSFVTGIDEAFNHLAQIDRLTYRDVLDTHKTLFEGNCSPTPPMENAIFINVIRAGDILDATQ